MSNQNQRYSMNLTAAKVIEKRAVEACKSLFVNLTSVATLSAMKNQNDLDKARELIVEKQKEYAELLAMKTGFDNLVLDIRKAVAAANQSVGINDLLSEIRQKEQEIQFLEMLIRDVARYSEATEEIEQFELVLKESQQIEVPKERLEWLERNRSDTMTIIDHKKEKQKIEDLKRQILQLSDKVRLLNISNNIQIEISQPEVAEKVGLFNGE